MSTFIEKINAALGLEATQIEEAKAKKKMAGPPAAWGALYTPPNPDGSKKRCENCFMWVKGLNKCLILDKSEDVKKSMVCGYHVFGTPRTKWMEMGISAIPKDLAGLVEIGEGSCCHDCKFYFKPDKCSAVATEDGGSVPADVEDLGCCTRFTPK